MKPSILLHTKFLVPRPTPELLPRPHLVEWLDSQMDRRLILISAPAGYGKTTLLADFLNGSNRPYAWYQLDANDSDPTVFLTYLIEALRRMKDAPIPSQTLSARPPNPCWTVPIRPFPPYGC
jgi:LuxR family transcriptional regulator, maltose regulon positive regulatory protein